MANRVTQSVKFVIADANDRAVRVTQAVKFLLADGADNPLRVTQVVKFVITRPSGGIDIDQTVTYDDPDTFPSGGEVIVKGPGVIIQLGEVYKDADVFPAGGVVSSSGAVPPSGAPGGGGVGGGRSTVSSPALEAGQADRALEAEAEQARAVVRSWTESPGGRMSGLGDLGPNEILGYDRSHNNAPEKLARVFVKRGRVTTPAVVAGDVTVVSFVVPTGYWCRIQQLSCVYTGTGFVDGNGDLEWRLAIGPRYARNMWRILFELGTASCGFPINDYIAVPSGRLIRMIVKVVNISGNIQIGSSLILCAVQGYMIPNGSPGLKD